MKAPKQRDDAGTGMIDVVVATFLMSLLVMATAVALAGSARAQLSESVYHYAQVVADDMLQQAEEEGCGTATGYGTTAQADSLASRCTWGYQNLPALGDVYTAQESGAQPGECPVADEYLLPGPACYHVPELDLDLFASLTFTWGPQSGTDPCSLASGTPAQAPDELVATATVTWQGPGEGAKEVIAQKVEPIPAVLSSGWASGGMGAVAVSATAGTPVGLVVGQWGTSVNGYSSPPPSITSLAGSDGCAVFPFVPSSSGDSYQVWTGSPSQAGASFTPTSGEWDVVAQ